MMDNKQFPFPEDDELIPAAPGSQESSANFPDPAEPPVEIPLLWTQPEPPEEAAAIPVFANFAPEDPLPETDPQPPEETEPSLDELFFAPEAPEQEGFPEAVEEDVIPEAVEEDVIPEPVEDDSPEADEPAETEPFPAATDAAVPSAALAGEGFAEIPEADVSGEAAPGEIAAGEAVPGEIAAGEAVPGEIAADKAVPGEIAADKAVPGEMVPEPVPEGPRGAEFMAHIPDVESDYPEERRFSDHSVGQEITPDSQAMAFHGMLEHGEEEPPFDMDLLNDIEEAENLAEAEDAEPLPPAPEEEPQQYQDGSPAAPPRQRPVRKGRPKRKKGEGLFGIPNILATCVWLALIVAIGVTAGRMLWVCASDVLAFGRPDQPVTVTVYESDSLDTIIDKLYNNGLIRYKGLFSLYASISDAQEEIKPGIYDLNTRYDYHALVNAMSPSSTREVVQLTIPEGFTCRQIFALLEENRVCTVQDISNYAASGELADYWFLEQVERGSQYCLEGFLFPDTYEFYKNSTPREALEKMLDNFGVRFTEEMQAQLAVLNEQVTGGTYGVREVTIVASMIEKESAAPAESPAIAGVIYNRLFRWGDTPAYLNIDASIVYALEGKTELTREDLQIDSPFNTYTHMGLTPTPIANPGLSSLEAALNPDMHGYYYYVLNPATGMHQFSSTYEEHSGYVAQFAG